MEPAERATRPVEQVYDGFISYSHAADGLLAPRLQAGLQRFAKPWWAPQPGAEWALANPGSTWLD